MLSKIKFIFLIILKIIFKKQNEKFVDFPLNTKKIFSRFLINFDNHKFLYFVRLHNKLNKEKLLSYNFLGFDNNLVYEIFKSEYTDNNLEFLPKDDGIIFFSSLENNNSFQLKLGDKKYIKSNFNNLENLSFKFKKNQKVIFSSNNKTIFSKKFYLNKNVKKKLNLVLFIDGLPSDIFFNKTISENNLKFTKKYFSNSYKFKNHYSNGEWSLPSAGSFFTGHYLDKHKLFHPNKNTSLPNNLDTLAEIFSKNDFSTLKINGSPRLSPMYGFIKGFDRTIYKREMNSNETVRNFMEFDKFIYGKKFIWLTFFDLHYLRDKAGFEIDVFERDQIKKKNKSPFDTECEIMKNIFYEKLKQLDENLSILYQYLDETYDENEVIVHLISDHGQSFFDNNRNILKNLRVRTPWLIKESSVKEEKIINDLTENVDFYATILNQNRILDNDKKAKIDGKIPKIFNGEKKKYVICQSLYPKQTFKVRIDFDEIVFYFESKELVDENGNIKNIKNIDNYFEKKRNIDDETLNKKKLEAKKILDEILSKQFSF